MTDDARGEPPSPEPIVSVVIPTRNRRRLLRQALRSALGQRSVDIEVIVVDDGSSDGSDEVATASGDGRTRLIRMESSRGVATARNAGAGVARGAWLAFLDDDDLWAPWKLRRQLDAALAANAGWAYAGAVEVDEVGEVLGGVAPPDPARLLAELPRRNPLPAGSSNVIVGTQTFRAADGFDERLRHLADWDLWLRLAALGPPACVSEPLVAYRFHASQATLDTRGMIAEGRLLQRRHGIDVNSVRRWLAWSHLRRGERREAASAYARAAVNGDLGSIVRALIACVHPRPVSLGRRGADDAGWARAAEAWVPEATAEIG